MATIRRRGKTYHVQIRKVGYPPVTKSFSSITVARKWTKAKDTLKELGNRYHHAAYKILEWNDPKITKLIEQDDESISEAIEAAIKYYKLGEKPSVLIASTLKPKLFAQQIEVGKMKGSIDGDNVLKVIVTNPPEVVRTYLSDLDFFEDMDGVGLFIRISEGKD